MASVANINDVLAGHVALEIECVDRLYLNAYGMIGVATTGERSRHVSWWEWHALIVHCHSASRGFHQLSGALGDIEKFMGDGMMATFNSCGNQPDHALRATRAGHGRRSAR
jgi:class 3 adenylate cyclase